MRLDCVVFASSVLFSGVAISSTSHDGELVRPGTGIKSVAIIDQQKLLAHSEIEAVSEFIDNSTDICIRCMNGDATSDPAVTLKSSGSELAVLIRCDTNSPSLLIAPEDKWCIVNLARIVNDLPSEKAKKKFFVTRSRKEIIKAFSLLCGGGSSQFKDNIMNTATPRQLDYVKEQIPLDMLARYNSYLESFGVKPKEYVPYIVACSEGWAPEPTNDVQRTEWKQFKRSVK